MDPDIARELAMMGPPGDLTPPLEEDEEDDPAPAYTPRVAPQLRSNYGGEEGVMDRNNNGEGPILEDKERLPRAG
ncbi:uncharacterized protein ColSpa_06369 [Colletotrichum spaethianum]|uniref:Uncharacterized protein n=1 Tax=Colletotrichum spaethianum TaxID=700344 RepID=A0AA37LGQ0_9PEZI|nr:uncharacterized protein ColSpa_06369 [Colletotrichum spaethianum]GKT46188.1 hypothetical protein ColSpa_06369 [Colletotrichum spaethianum]